MVQAVVMEVAARLGLLELMVRLVQLAQAVVAEQLAQAE
jgi:hypothetical protein